MAQTRGVLRELILGKRLGSEKNKLIKVYLYGCLLADVIFARMGKKHFSQWLRAFVCHNQFRIKKKRRYSKGIFVRMDKRRFFNGSGLYARRLFIPGFPISAGVFRESFFPAGKCRIEKCKEDLRPLFGYIPGGCSDRNAAA